MSAVVQPRSAPRPSAAGRWCGGKCPGSVALAARYPEDTSAEAEDGTRLHEVAAAWLNGGDPPPDEDRDVVGRYISDVRQAVAGVAPGYELHIERTVAMASNPDFEGTPDAVLLDPFRKHVTIWDLKTGWRIVEAFMNWQLLSYAAILSITGWTIELRIVQPRPYHPDGPVRSWGLTWAQLQPHMIWIKRAIREAMAPDASVRAGEHCIYCEAIPCCPAARDISLRAVEYSTRDSHEIPDEFLGRELEVMQSTLKLLTLRTAALEEVAGAKLRAGARLPGLSMREGKGGRVKWNQDDAATRSILQMLTGEDYAEPKMPTPKQLQDRHNISPEIIKPLTRRQPGKMVVSTDAASMARKVFGEKPDMSHITPTPTE